MPGSRPQEGKNGKVALRVRSREHVEVVSEIVTVPVGIPTDVAVRLMVEAVAFTVTDPFFQTITGAGLVFPCPGINGGAITGDGTSSPKANPIVDNTAMPRTDFFTLLISVSSLSVLDC